MNPVLVEITRGGQIESQHRGSVVVVDDQDHVVWSVGNPEVSIYPRSAVKAFQAMPLLESGAAEAFDLTDSEIAVACASHSGPRRPVMARRPADGARAPACARRGAGAIRTR